MGDPERWQDEIKASLGETLRDRLVTKLLERSNLTRAQFETLLVDQLGSRIADKRLDRDEMTRLRRDKRKISRGAFYRTLEQARSNTLESIYTILLLGYCGIFESPGLALYLEASDRLKNFIGQLREAHGLDDEARSRMVDSLIDDLENAYATLKGKGRDM